MASQDSVKIFKEHLSRITKFKVDDLVSRASWGTLTFATIKPQIQACITIANQFAVLPLDMLTDQILEEIRSDITQAAEMIERINDFRIDADGSGGHRQHILQEANSKIEKLIRVAAHWLPFLTCQRGMPEEVFPHLTGLFEDTQKKLAAATEGANSRLKEIADIIDKARQAAAISGAAVFADAFNTEADKNENAAGTWLKMTGALAALTVGIALVLWAYAEEAEPGLLFQKLSTKLVILGVLLSATVWCGKNYKSLKHLAVVNRHRVSSIRTMEAFYAAAKDQAVKDLVLLEVTKAAFGHVPTGFVGDGNAEGDMKIIEVARSIVDKDRG